MPQISTCWRILSVTFVYFYVRPPAVQAIVPNNLSLRPGMNSDDMDEGMAALAIEIQRPSCHKRLNVIVHSAWFSRVILGVILLSCIELGFESP